MENLIQYISLFGIPLIIAIWKLLNDKIASVVKANDSLQQDLKDQDRAFKIEIDKLESKLTISTNQVYDAVKELGDKIQEWHLEMVKDYVTKADFNGIKGK